MKKVKKAYEDGLEFGRGGCENRTESSLNLQGKLYESFHKGMRQGIVIYLERRSLCR